jgi:uncharacterized paraquat-inducible protein A
MSPWLLVVLIVVGIVLLLGILALVRLNQFSSLSNKKKKDKIRFCPKCHNQIWESSSICPKCGKKLK